MCLRLRLPVRVPLDMTALIDIVFQLLIFFILTLQIAEQEGDLAVKLPVGDSRGMPRADFMPPVVVELQSGPRGELAQLSLAGQPLANLAELHDRVERLVNADPLLAQTGSAILHCDENLAYEHTLATVTALSGARQSDGTIRPLMSSIRLRPAR